MELRDARLRDAEDLADLPEGQLLVVVERDDELLPLGQARDRLAERLAKLRLRHRHLRLGGVRILERVDQGDRVSPARARPELVERGDRGARDLEERVLELLLRDPEVGRDLLVVRRAVELALELRDRPLDVAGAGAHRARHPVHRAKLVDDRALDARDRVGLELDVAPEVEALDRADQAEEAVRDEVSLLHVRREAAPEAAGDVLDERRVREDQAIAQGTVAGALELAPECVGVEGGLHERQKDMTPAAPLPALRSGGSPSGTPATPSPPSRRREGRPRLRSPRREPPARAAAIAIAAKPAAISVKRTPSGRRRRM